MSLPYIKIETEEAVDSKKNILGSEMNILQLTNKMNEYKKLRKFELIKKARLKTLVRQNMLKVNTLINELPQPEGKIKREVSTARQTEDKKKKDINSELEDIRKKLNELR